MPEQYPPKRTVALAGLVLLIGSLAGCGGANQDFGGFSRNLGGDIGNSYNTSIGSRYGDTNGGTRVASAERGTYPMIETSFQLPKIPGDPFDYEQVNVQVTLRRPDNGTVEVPAFFDGGTTWRMRYTPTLVGKYALVTIKLNRETAHEEKLDKKEWMVSGDPKPGFVRVDKGDHSRFVFDSGERYYPLGHNQAWQSAKLPDIPTLFGKMGTAGENWSRVWMTAWDGKNLDWPADGKPKKLGDIDLEAAKKWDDIVQSAEKNGIYFQLCFQHHGQYSSEKGYKFSSNVNPNWESNPYNVKNGGFLASPEDFFTDPKARALTRRKLYYMVSRWGYSPNILAWELFNEVEGTDAAHGKMWEQIAMWHKEMALFLRQFDGYRHLITTSSYAGVALDSPVWDTVDYIQRHVYAGNVISAVGITPALNGKALNKPMFTGEFGPSDLKDADGVALHNGLWSSLMSNPSGAAQYWDWENIEQHDLYSHYQAAKGFLVASALANHGSLTTTALPVETSQRAALRFGPGGGWGDATQNEFVVGENGIPSGIATFPAYLQGQAHRNMMPRPLTFQVSYAQPGAFKVAVGQVARAGAKLVVRVDGKAVERDFPASDKDYTPEGDRAVAQAEVAAGAHTITVENTGSDWAVVRQFVFTNYAPSLAAPARVGKDYAVAWVYHRDGVDLPANKEAEPVTGRVVLSGLKPGRYRATWWDTRGGKSIDASDLTVAKEKENVALSTPPITRDVALYVMKALPPGKTGPKGKGKEKVAASALESKPLPAKQ